MSTLYFIRHGQASFGKDRYDNLSEKGRAQAALLAEYLVENNVLFDVVIRGPQDRHIQTAAELENLCRERSLPHPGTICMDELAEYDFKRVFELLVPVLVAEDKTINELASRMFTDPKAFQVVFETVMLRWVSGDPSIPAQISWKAFKSRVNAGIDTIMSRYGRGAKVGVFTSGGPISVTIQRALGVSDETAMRLNWQIVNCSITRFKCTNARIMLATFNEHAWLERKGDEGLVTYR